MATASALLLAAGPSAASTPAPGPSHGPRGVTVVVCGRDGRVEVLVRVDGVVLLPIGPVTVRVGDACGPHPSAPPTAPPSTPPGTPPATPTGPPPVTPPPTTPPTTRPVTSPPPPPPPAASPPAASPVAGSAPGPARKRPDPPVRSGPGRAPAARVSASPSGAQAYALPQPGGEPYPHGAGGGAARWWLLTMAVVLLPAVLAAVPYRTFRRRR